MSPTFQPPVVYDLPAILPETVGVQYLSWRHYGDNARGLSVVRVGGVYTTVDTPTVIQLADAGGRDGIDFFLGGHVYTVTQDIADALTAAGYSTGADPVDTSHYWSAYTGKFWGELAGHLWSEL